MKLGIAASLAILVASAAAWESEQTGPQRVAAPCGAYFENSHIFEKAALSKADGPVVLWGESRH